MQNAFSWLLCARRTLKSAELLAAIRYVAGQLTSEIRVDQFLGLCHNFVVLDTHLDTFRFSHLSVREFLESQAPYSVPYTNALVAETCLFDLQSSLKRVEL